MQSGDQFRIARVLMALVCALLDQSVCAFHQSVGLWCVWSGQPVFYPTGSTNLVKQVYPFCRTAPTPIAAYGKLEAVIRKDLLDQKRIKRQTSAEEVH